MKHTTSTRSRMLATLLLALAAAGGAGAQDTYPSRAIKMVVAQPPGNSADGDTIGIGGIGQLALVGPAGMPSAIRDRLADEVRKIIVLPDFQSWVIGSGGLAEPLTPEQSSAYVRAEAARWAEVIRAVGLKLD